MLMIWTLFLMKVVTPTKFMKMYVMYNTISVILLSDKNWLVSWGDDGLIKTILALKQATAGYSYQADDY